MNDEELRAFLSKSTASDKVQADRNKAGSNGNSHAEEPRHSDPFVQSINATGQQTEPLAETAPMPVQEAGTLNSTSTAPSGSSHSPKPEPSFDELMGLTKKTDNSGSQSVGDELPPLILPGFWSERTADTNLPPVFHPQQQGVARATIPAEPVPAEPVLAQPVPAETVPVEALSTPEIIIPPEAQTSIEGAQHAAMSGSALDNDEAVSAPDALEELFGALDTDEITKAPLQKPVVPVVVPPVVQAPKASNIETAALIIPPAAPEQLPVQPLFTSPAATPESGFAHAAPPAPVQVPPTEYEKISVTGGDSKKRRVLPWIVVGVGAVIAIIAAIVVLNIAQSADPQTPPVAEPATPTPVPVEPEPEPETEPEPEPEPEQSVLPGTEAPDVDPGETWSMEVGSWGVAIDVSRKLGRVNYSISGDNLELANALASSLPDSCSAARTGWGMTKSADGTFTALKPDANCAESPEVYDTLWGLMAKMAASAKPIA